MTDAILVYITCESVKQAKSIGSKLLESRLAGCINIIPRIHSFYFWPVKSGKIESANETVLLVKTIKSKYKTLESEVHKIHSYTTPAIFAIPLLEMDKKILRVVDRGNEKWIVYRGPSEMLKSLKLPSLSAES